MATNGQTAVSGGLVAVEPSKVSANGWVRMGLQRSGSDLGKFYVIGQRILKTGVIQKGCDCPHQIYRLNKTGGQCKHIQAFYANPASSDTRLTPEGVNILTAIKLAEQANQNAMVAAKTKKVA
jgi:predicted nucleic acid-binding Zn finger protein